MPGRFRNLTSWLALITKLLFVSSAGACGEALLGVVAGGGGSVAGFAAAGATPIVSRSIRRLHVDE
jgi:hypothetical protein